jgi:hypothetical protein
MPILVSSRSGWSSASQLRHIPHSAEALSKEERVDYYQRLWAR